MLKNFLKFAFIGMFAFSFASCSDDDPEPGTGSETEKDTTYSAIVSQYLTNTVQVTYDNLADCTAELVDCLNTLKSNKTDANVKAACEKFLEARAWWEKSEAFLFGPATDFGIDSHIDSWPLDRDGLVAQMSNASHIASLSGDDGDEWAGSHLGQELLGFHGIEYIIFANGQPKAAANIPDNEIIYAVAVAGDLRNKCWQLQLSWAGEDGVPAERLAKIEDLEFPYTVSVSGFSYSENMRMAGQAGSVYRSLTDALQAIVDGCASIADEVGTQKIGKPYYGEDVNYIESPYSHKSIQDFYDNMVSIENVYMGGIEGKRSDSHSIHAYIKSINSELDTRCVNAIANAKNKIASMAAPFVNNINDPSAGEAITACSDLESVLIEVKSELAK